MIGKQSNHMFCTETSSEFQKRGKGLHDEEGADVATGTIRYLKAEKKSRSGYSKLIDLSMQT